MLKIGLTGGIGSGKTSVAMAFGAMGVPIYFSDTEAKRLMVGPLRPQIEDLLGETAFNDGQLNRQAIGERIFSNPSLLQQLNKIVHPAVETDFLSWAELQTSEIVIEESAILVESNAIKLVDKVIVVTAPLEVRIERTMKRDNLSRQQVLAKINNQIDQTELLTHADFVIDTYDDFIIGQVMNIMKKLLPLHK